MSLDTSPVLRDLDKAKMRFNMAESNEFLTNLLLSYQWEYDEEVESMQTDGRTITINPKHLADLDTDQKVGLLAHLALNMGLNHMERVSRFEDKANRKLMNKACEIEANSLLVGYGYAIPPGTEQDHDGRYVDMPAERIYHALRDEQQQNNDNNGGGDGDGDDGEGDDGDGSSGQGGGSPWSDHLNPSDNAQEAQAIQQDIEEAIGRAITHASLAGDKSAGMIPGNAARAYQEILEPKQPWNVLLQDFMTGFDKSDYSLKRPNPSYFPDFLFPTLWGETLDKALVFIDVSGSIGQDQLDVFFAEIQSIRDQFPIEELHIIGFDTGLTYVNILTPQDDLDGVVLNGGGGTYINPVINYIMEQAPEFAVVFTDGYFSPYEPEELETPILWLIHDNDQFDTNIGEVIYHEA